MTALQGKNVLLTGASRGLGAVIAEALAKRGAHLALAARSEEGLRTVADALNKYGVQTMIFPTDLAQTSERQALVSTALEKFGHIDILINNAGIETEGAFLDLTWEAIRETIEINLAAPMQLTHLTLPSMLKQGSGHIVNIASIGAKNGVAYAAVYCGTKAGLAEWTRGLRLELAGTGIHFSTIFPGYVTEVGMFARFNVTPPWLIGSCKPEQVAQAVIRAIEQEKLEIIVNARSIIMRLSFILNELSASLGDWLMHQSGAVGFQRRKVGL